MGGTATYPRPPRNLREYDRPSSGTVRVSWDVGLAGPELLKEYKVYVDGSLRTTVTETPNSDYYYPKTWAKLDLSSGDHTIEVSFVTRDGKESEKSNSITVTI
jgi:hypothetical protein